MSNDTNSKSSLDRDTQSTTSSIANFVVSLALESERISVVMGVAQVDLTLERLLKSILIPDSGGKDSLFDPDRPISSFSTKITLSHRLGLIDSDFEHVLQMMRKIRNDFAHSIQTESLSDPDHRCRLKEITNAMKNDHQFKEMNDLMNSKLQSTDHSNFCAAIAVILMELEFAMISFSRIQHKYVVKFSVS